MPHTLFVCTSCGSAHRTKQAIRRSGGERLLEQLQTLHHTSLLEADLSIQAADCMGACEQHCTIALSAPGKHTYLFGNLPTDDDHLESTAVAVLDGAKQYHAQSDGSISYIKCPELLKKRVLAKIPPLPSDRSDFQP
jgi:predicted metal-binding protein